MANVGEFVKLLTSLSSKENEERQQAEKLYKQAKIAEPDSLLVGFMSVAALDASQVDRAIKMSALVFLRQMMTKGTEENFVYSRITPQHRQEVAEGLLTLYSQQADEVVRRKVGEVITRLAEYVCDEDDKSGWLVQGQSCGWPKALPLLMQLAHCGVNSNAASCATALRTVKDLVNPLKGEIISQQQAIGELLQNDLASADLNVQTGAVLLICEMVQELDKKQWAPLAATIPVVMQILTKMAQANQTEELQEIIQAFIEIVGVEQDFFKKSIETSMEPATFFANCIKSKDAEEGIRNLSMEWLVSFCEKKPKWLAKSVPNYAQLALSSCMVLMLEIEDGESELKEWAGRMDDEEGEEDADGLFHTGEQCVDRIVEAMEMDAVSGALFALIGQFSSQEQWQAKHAALAAVRQTVEYVEDQTHMQEMAKLLMSYADHPHPRVRYAALHAIGQLANDQAPQFQEQFHGQVMPLLMRLMDDPADRVAGMAMSAFTSFGEELGANMSTYAAPFMEKLGARLIASQHRGVREESITAIAVIAGVIEEDFKVYYDAVMPILKQIVMNATSEKENRLRGKAFECMSLLGVAVGSERFLPDAQAAITEMLKNTMEADDLQKEYIKEATERICHCLKKDFVQFLPLVLPSAFKTLDLSQDTSAATAAKKEEDDEDDIVEVSTKAGVVKVKSSRFEEMNQSVQLLNTCLEEMEEAYYDFVEPTAKALLPIIQLPDELTYLCEEVRLQAFTTWSLLVKAAANAAKAPGDQASQLSQQLLKTVLTECMKALSEGRTEPDELAAFANGISQSLKNAPACSLAPEECKHILDTLFARIEESFQRTETLKKEMKHIKAETPAELQQEDEDEEANPLEDEDACRRSYEEVLGALMKNNPAGFVPYLETFGGKLQQWLSTKENTTLGLYLACDFLEHLKEHSTPIWPTFMMKCLDGLGDKDSEVRMAAGYAINLAANIPQFAEAAPEAFRRLAKIVGGPPPKKRDERANSAMDNAVAALLNLAKEQSAACPPDVNAFALVVSKLPLKQDVEEAKKVHALVADMVLAQHAPLLGPGSENVGPILAALADVYRHEQFSTKDIDAKIVQIFKALPQAMLVTLAQANAFTEKQQKRIEKLVQS